MNARSYFQLVLLATFMANRKALPGSETECRYRYVVNHTKKQYVDKKHGDMDGAVGLTLSTAESGGGDLDGDDDMAWTQICIHPLPLLTIHPLPLLTIHPLLLLTIHPLPLLTIHSLPLLTINSLPLLTIHPLPLLTIHSLPLLTIHPLPLLTIHPLPLLTIHPLPLLTAEGNGRGGGDYYGSDMELVGTWARDVISVERQVPEGYSELVCNFTEHIN